MLLEALLALWHNFWDQLRHIGVTSSLLLMGRRGAFFEGPSRFARVTIHLTENCNLHVQRFPSILPCHALICVGRGKHLAGFIRQYLAVALMPCLKLLYRIITATRKRFMTQTKTVSESHVPGSSCCVSWVLHNDTGTFDRLA